MRIKAVLFDLDDTLLWDERSVDEAFAATCEEAARHHLLNAAELEQSVRNEALKLYERYDVYPFTKQIGIGTFEALWANFTEAENSNEQFVKLREIAPTYRKQTWTNGMRSIGVEDETLGERLGEMFAAERRARPLVYEETRTVLEQLKEDYRLLMLTNGAPSLQNEKIAGIPWLASYFEHIVISGQFGAGKPAASIFNYAMSLLGIDAAEGIMVGDKLGTDIIGAQGVGMKAVWVNRNSVHRSDEIVPDYEISNLHEVLRIVSLKG